MTDRTYRLSQKTGDNLRRVFDRVLKSPPGRPPEARVTVSPESDGITFQNVGSYAINPYEIMRVDGTVMYGGFPIRSCQTPDAVFPGAWLINGEATIQPGDTGTAQTGLYQFAAYDTGSPAAGDRLGYKSGQGTLTVGGLGGFIVHEIWDSTQKIAVVEFTALTAVFGKPISAIPGFNSGTNIPGSGSVIAWCWNGTELAATSLAFTAYNFAPVKITDDQLQEFVMANGLFLVPTPENYIYLALNVDPDIAPGASGDFTLSDGDTVTAENIGADTILAGDQAVVFQDLATLDFYAFKGRAAPVRFELTADLVYATPPGSDNAKIVVWDAGSSSYVPTGATIRVFDFTVDGAYGTWSGKAPSGGISGYQGWAIEEPDSGAYEIIWMEQKAQLISFRLYQRLQTSDASQSACVVTAFWNGRDPDPTSAGISVYNLALDYSGLYKFSGDANAVGYAVWNEKTSKYEIISLEGDGRNWVLFKNQSGYSVSLGYVLGVTGITRDGNSHTNKRNIYTVERPSTTFRRTYLICGYGTVANNAIGLAFGFDGPMEATIGTGTPANGEGWGPKPGDFGLWVGWPGFVVDGLNTDDGLAVVRFQPIMQFYGRSTGSTATNNNTTAYKIYTGGAGGEADSGFTVPSAYLRGVGIVNNDWIWGSWANNQWYIGKLC